MGNNSINAVLPLVTLDGFFSSEEKMEIKRYECKYIAEEFMWEVTGESGWRF